MLELEDIVQEKADKLVRRMRESFSSTGCIDLHHAFRAISVDVISDYAFGNCYGFLGKKNFGAEFFDMIRGFGPAFWFFQQFPAIQGLSLSTPFWLAKLTSEPLTRMMLHREVGCMSLNRIHGLTSLGLSSPNIEGEGRC